MGFQTTPRDGHSILQTPDLFNDALDCLDSVASNNKLIF
jgi:hypothetical protein